MDPRTAALWRKYADQLPSLANYPLESERFTAGDSLAVAGEPLTRLSFVLEGFATVHNRTENGRAVLLREDERMPLIGELELLMNLPVYTSDVRATAKGAMLAIPLSAAVREQIFTDAALLGLLGRVVAKKLERTSRLATQDRLYPVANRLAAYLLYIQQNRRAEVNLTRLSELMGTSYRHLLRTIREFCENGWIAHEGGGLHILNEAELARLAGQIRYD
ncbi:MAG TPA: helix-turn-helix domain-containing protein [Candidatus Limiplasma sp.]|nr:helix-turn-helix domain-containing protein [Candidatus Limiplasma sp.]